jgi:hypothetical protein
MSDPLKPWKGAIGYTNCHEDFHAWDLFWGDGKQCSFFQRKKINNLYYSKSLGNTRTLTLLKGILPSYFTNYPHFKRQYCHHILPIIHIFKRSIAIISSQLSNFQKGILPSIYPIIYPLFFTRGELWSYPIIHPDFKRKICYHIISFIHLLSIMIKSKPQGIVK